MTPEQQKAKEILIKYISIIGSECEHDSYCDRPECNKLGYIFCHVDYAKAKACAIEEVKAVVRQINYCLLLYSKNKNNTGSTLLKIKLSEYKQVLTEIEKILKQ